MRIHIRLESRRQFWLKIWDEQMIVILINSNELAILEEFNKYCLSRNTYIGKNKSKIFLTYQLLLYSSKSCSLKLPV
jgi:hypothetical protein